MNFPGGWRTEGLEGDLMFYRSARCVFALFVAFASLAQMGCAMAMRSPDETASESPLASINLSPKIAPADSLFPGDQLVLNDSQIEKIFGTKIGVPENGKLSVVRYGAWPAWYWSEEFA